WSDRVLGESTKVVLPQRSVWAATGNNLKVGHDLARRAYWIRLDARVARPWTRTTFKHPRVVAYVLRHRGELLADVLTLARPCFAAGCPAGDSSPLGGFEAWTTT